MFRNFLIVSLSFVVSDVCALDKIKNIEYINSVHHGVIDPDENGFHSMKNIMRGELYDLYGGEFRGGAQVGFDTWKKDAEYLSSPDFLLKSQASVGLEDCVRDFDFWIGASVVGRLFDIHWPLHLRVAAVSTLNCMLQNYNSPNISGDQEFIQRCRDEIKCIIEDFGPENESSSIIGDNGSNLSLCL